MEFTFVVELTKDVEVSKIVVVVVVDVVVVVVEADCRGHRPLSSPFRLMMNFLSRSALRTSASAFPVAVPFHSGSGLEKYMMRLLYVLVSYLRIENVIKWFSCKKFRSSLRHDADVSAGDEVAVLVAAVGREAPGDLLVVRRAEHVPDLVRRHRLVTVLGDPPEVAVVLDGHTC